MARSYLRSDPIAQFSRKVYTTPSEILPTSEDKSGLRNLLCFPAKPPCLCREGLRAPVEARAISGSISVISRPLLSEPCAHFSTFPRASLSSRNERGSARVDRDHRYGTKIDCAPVHPSHPLPAARKLSPQITRRSGRRLKPDSLPGCSRHVFSALLPLPITSSLTKARREESRFNPPVHARTGDHA